MLSSTSRTLTVFVVSQVFTPEELLRVYANEAYFGRMRGESIYGFASASAAYFGKPGNQLTFGEAATIAGMMRSPHYFSPVTHPDRATKRRNMVLERMHRDGIVDASQYRIEIEAPIRIAPASLGS